jgi:hypothetical protein
VYIDTLFHAIVQRLGVVHRPVVRGIAILDSRSIVHQPDDAGIIAIPTEGAMTMNGKEIWIWLAVGLVPYHVKYECLAGGGHRLYLRSLFWSLVVHRRRSGRRDWRVRVPLIESLRDVVWATVTHLCGDASPDE